MSTDPTEIVNYPQWSPVPPRDDLPVPQQPPYMLVPPIKKDKSVAVLLAIFFGFWSFIYTYKRDAALFWINLIATLCSFGLWGFFIAWPWAIILAAARPKAFYEGFPYAT